MRYRLEITASAKAEFEREMAYSKNKWLTQHAANYRRALMREVRAIVANPYIYTLKPHLGANIRSVDFKGTRIVYRVHEEQKLVEILGFPSIHSHKTFEG